MANRNQYRQNQKFRLILSALLALIIILLGTLGLVYLSIKPLQVVCAFIALLGAVFFDFIQKSYKRLKQKEKQA